MYSRCHQFVKVYTCVYMFTFYVQVSCVVPFSQVSVIMVTGMHFGF